MFALINHVCWILADWTNPAEGTNEFWSSFPIQASSFAEDNDWLYFMITVVCIIFFIPMAFAMFYFSVKYNKAKGEKAESNVAHNTPIELLWSVGPSFLLIGMFVLGAKSYLDIRTVPDGANEVRVTAQKWSWSVDYGGGTFHPELHLLLGEPAKMTMVSNDVLHALYVPAFRAKKDIVPGRFNHMWFKPTVANQKVSPEILAEEIKANAGKPWDYRNSRCTPDGYEFFDLYCAEYCGKDHSMMQSVAVVHETLEDLDAWIKTYSSRQSETPSEYGEKLYQRRGCSGCHSLDGRKIVGPSFKGTFGNRRDFVAGASLNADDNYVRESILNPKAKVVAGYNPVMPSYKGQFSEDDLYCIVEFLKSVSDHTPSASPEDSDADTTGSDTNGADTNGAGAAAE